jgi:hypothetical protein
MIASGQQQAARLGESITQKRKGGGWSSSSDEKPWTGYCTTACPHRAVGRGYAGGKVGRVEAIAASTRVGGVVLRELPCAAK